MIECGAEIVLRFGREICEASLKELLEIADTSGAEPGRSQIRATLRKFVAIFWLLAHNTCDGILSKDPDFYLALRRVDRCAEREAAPLVG